MRVLFLRSLVLGGLVLAAAATVASALTAPRGAESLEIRLPYDPSRLVLRPEAMPIPGFERSAAPLSPWQIQRNPRTGLVHFAHGSGLSVDRAVSSEALAASLGEGFLLDRGELVGMRPDNSDLRNVRAYRGRWAVHYRQVIAGIPVHQASAFVVLSDAGNVIAFGSGFFPEPEDLVVTPALSGAEAIDTAAKALATAPRSDRPVTAELVLVPAPAGELLELTAAWKVTFESGEPFGRWESFVHGQSGDILGRANRYHFVDVTGNSDGEVEGGTYCDGSFQSGFEHMTIAVQGGGSAETDAAGDFTVPHGGASPVTVDAAFLGPFIDVNVVGGIDATQSVAATPGTPVQITWDQSNSRRDERDTFYNGNLVHDFMKDIDSGFTSLDYSMPTSVRNTSGICPGNAWWDGTGMNYCAPGGGFANTGRIGNVVYHEYGHGVSQEWYNDNGSSLPSGDMHEGNSDILATFVDRESIVGLGFFDGNCTGGIRDSDNSLQWPTDNNGGHFGGQIIAGFYWDAWQSLLAAKPQAEADGIAFDAWHFGRGMGTPLNQADQVLWTFIADDDDANLDNGTPNHDHWCLGAANHGFDCPEILVGVIIAHEKLGHTEDGSLGFDVAATIVSTETSLDPSELKLLYRVNGAAFSEVLMTATANPDEFSASIPPLGQFSEVEYYIQAKDLAGNERTAPSLAPTQLFAFDVAFSYDDLEGATGGWTAGLPGDDATTGQWELIDPIGTAAQPGDDSTPAPGVLAFITGQCGGPNCGGGCTLGCNDIDNGTTTLLSPVYDLSGATNAKVKYDRWYSNNTGAEPNADNWVVDVSNDGGSTWTNVENTTVSNASWSARTADITALFGTPDQVQLRFRASDLAGGSVVEAGVDEVRVLAEFGGAVGVEDLVQVAPIAFSLSQNQPNPFRPATRIEYAVPFRSEVRLSVYNVSGRMVRDLAGGVREAGRYSVNWDGRDASGARVAAGVYFYRLSAGSETLTKKMTVMQ